MTIEPASREPRDPSDRGSATEATARVKLLRDAESTTQSWLRLGLPVVVILVAVAVVAALVATREKPKTHDTVVPSPLVRVMKLVPENLRLRVVARGTVMPRTESDLVAEVRGRVVWISPNLVVGGLFEMGDELLRLDAREYRIARDRARATVALRESEARLARADVDRRRELMRRGASSAADLEQFENRDLVASASLAEARAVLEQAELDYERTVLRAPFAGRVRDRSADIGLFVSPGTKLGRIFAVDFAEVRLPIQVDDLAFLDVDLDGPGMAGVAGARVALTGRLGGREFVWPATLDRAEAAIDDQTRMLHVVARIDDPYALVQDPPVIESTAGGVMDPANSDRSGMPNELARPRITSDSRVPLPAGLFVTAEIEGRAVEGVFVLPMLALRDGNRVFVAEPTGAASEADKQGLLSVREVSVLRRERDRVLVDAGLRAGDRVVVSPLRIHSEGMSLRLVPASDS